MTCPNCGHKAELHHRSTVCAEGDCDCFCFADDVGWWAPRPSRWTLIRGNR